MSVEAFVESYKFGPSYEDLSGTTWSPNPLNDMESVWWIAVFFLFTKDFNVIYKKKSEDGVQNLPDLTEYFNHRVSRVMKQFRYTLRLFDETHTERTAALKSGLRFSRHFSTLHPAVSATTEWLNRAKTSLVGKYIHAEKTPERIDRQVAQGVYEVFRTCFQEMADRADIEQYRVRIGVSIYEIVERWAR